MKQRKKFRFEISSRAMEQVDKLDRKHKDDDYSCSDLNYTKISGSDNPMF